MASEVMYIVGELATTSILNQHHPIYILFVLYSKISIAHTPHQENFLQDMSHYRKPQFIELYIWGAQSQWMHLQYNPMNLDSGILVDDGIERLEEEQKISYWILP